MGSVTDWRDTFKAVSQNWVTKGGLLMWSDCDPSDAAGKTVAAVFDQDGHGYVLVFTDGTAIRYGYRETYEGAYAECEVFDG
jgi:hypothetical protein